jgi:hypothetical protein
MGFLADVQEGDEPDDWPTVEDADRQLMLGETHQGNFTGSTISTTADARTCCKEEWTAEGRGSGKYQGWSNKTGIDTHNPLVDVIAKQRLNTRNKTILSNFEPNLRQTFADQQAAMTGRRGNTGTRKRKAANSLSLGLESPTGFVLQGLPSTASTMMGV